VTQPKKSHSNTPDDRIAGVPDSTVDALQTDSKHSLMHPPLEEVVKNANGSKFQATLLAARRTRGIGEYFGATSGNRYGSFPPLVVNGRSKALSIALDEIAAGEISVTRDPSLLGDDDMSAKDHAKTMNMGVMKFLRSCNVDPHDPLFRPLVAEFIHLGNDPKSPFRFEDLINPGCKNQIASMSDEQVSLIIRRDLSALFSHNPHRVVDAQRPGVKVYAWLCDKFHGAEVFPRRAVLNVVTFEKGHVPIDKLNEDDNVEVTDVGPDISDSPEISDDEAFETVIKEIDGDPSSAMWLRMQTPILSLPAFDIRTPLGEGETGVALRREILESLLEEELRGGVARLMGLRSHHALVLHHDLSSPSDKLVALAMDQQCAKPMVNLDELINILSMPAVRSVRGGREAF
jgi:DNA-directed RNA polymerase omega subunit